MKDKLFDLCPAPLYRAYSWIKERPRYIKWWFQRANGKMPNCDWWEFHLSLTNYIEQGLRNLLFNGNTDWEYGRHKQVYKDLEFVYTFMLEYKHLQENGIWVYKTEEEAREREKIDLECFGKDGHGVYVSEEWYNNYQKRKEKAFRLLAKHLEDLWD